MPLLMRLTEVLSDCAIRDLTLDFSHREDLRPPQDPVDQKYLDNMFATTYLSAAWSPPITGKPGSDSSSLWVVCTFVTATALYHGKCFRQDSRRAEDVASPRWLARSTQAPMCCGAEEIKTTAILATFRSLTISSTALATKGGVYS